MLAAMPKSPRISIKTGTVTAVRTSVLCQGNANSKTRPRYRVGIVSFSTEPQVVAPLTSDRGILMQALTYLFPGAGTAIGDGV